VPGRKRDDQIAMNKCQRARGDDQTATQSAREIRDSALNLADGAHIDGAYLHPERRRHGLDGGKRAG
jgi:hypothetical protein